MNAEALDLAGYFEKSDTDVIAYVGGVERAGYEQLCNRGWIVRLS